MNTQRISHVTFETPDLERLIDYQVNILGLSVAARDGDRAFLKTATGQLACVLNQGTTARCTGLAFQVEASQTPAEIRKELSAKGITSESRTGDAPGIDEAVAFTDPNGTEVVVFPSFDPLGEDRSPKGFAPLKLGHVAFRVTDVAGSVGFYQSVLGFRISDQRGDFFVWMRCGPDHHTTNFVRGEPPKLHHFAFELLDRMEILRACDFLGSSGYPLIWGPGRHVIGDNIFTYHRDPDGNIVELYAEMARIDSESLGVFAPRPWRQHHPYRPTTWPDDTLTNIWGPATPPGFRD